MGAVGMGWLLLVVFLLPVASSADVFDCRDGSGRYIPQDWVCDNVEDCRNGLDEVNCTYPAICNPGFMVCPSGDCITRLFKCDGEVDCLNGEDERHCVDVGQQDDQAHVFVPVECKEFKCKNGWQCVTKSAVCDGIKDCPDGDDEDNCRYRCPLGHVKCVGDDVCIPNYWACDLEADCEDESDEWGCEYGPRTQGDERKHTHSFLPANCLRDEYQCAGHSCIPKNATCDGVRDCPYGDDERLYCKELDDNAGSLLLGMRNEIRVTSLLNASHKEYRRMLGLNYSVWSMDYNYQRKLILAVLSDEPLFSDRVHLATIDDANRVEVLSDKLPEVVDAVWDVYANNIYFSQRGSNPGITVCESRLIFCRKIVHFSTSHFQFYIGLVLDPSRGFLYWGEDDKVIKRAKFDGSEVEVLVDHKVLMLRGLTLDPERNELYFSDIFTTAIEKINLDTKQRHMAITGIPHVGRLSYFNKVLYWLDAGMTGERKLMAADVRERKPVALHSFNVDVWHLAVNHSAYQTPPDLVPHANLCQWITVNVVTNSSRLEPKCLWPDDYSPGSDGLVPTNGTWPFTLSKDYLTRLCLESSICLNGGRCSQRGNTTICRCSSGFYGKVCEMEKPVESLTWKLVLAFFLFVVAAAIVGLIMRTKCDGHVSGPPQEGAILPLVDDSIYQAVSNPDVSFNNPNHRETPLSLAGDG